MCRPSPQRCTGFPPKVNLIAVTEPVAAHGNPPSIAGDLERTGFSPLHRAPRAPVRPNGTESSRTVPSPRRGHIMQTKRHAEKTREVPAIRRVGSLAVVRQYTSQLPLLARGEGIPRALIQACSCGRRTPHTVPKGVGVTEPEAVAGLCLPKGCHRGTMLLRSTLPPAYS